MIHGSHSQICFQDQVIYQENIYHFMSAEANEKPKSLQSLIESTLSVYHCLLQKGINKDIIIVYEKEESVLK